MYQDRLEEAILLREEGRANQDQIILQKVRALLVDLVESFPEVAEIHYQTAVAHDNSGLGKEAIPYYLKALDLGLSGPDLERALLGLGSTYRYFGYYQKAVEILRRGVREFPENRALQAFLAMALYNTKSYKEAIEILFTNLMETTTDEKLQYYKRGIVAYAEDLDEKNGD